VRVAVASNAVVFVVAVAISRGALAQPPPARLAPILKDMTQQGSQFSVDELHQLGLEGLRMLLDWLFPETAKPSTLEPPSKLVLELVSQLGDDSFRLRDEAAEKLYQLGSAAHAALLNATQSSDAEVRWRAIRILRRWQIEREQDMGRYGPALAVYLSGIKDKQRLDELVTRVRLVLERSNGPPVGGRATVIAQCLNALMVPENEAFAAELKPLLEHRSPQVAMYLINMVAGYGSRNQNCPPLLLDALDCTRTEVVSAAIGAAGHLPLGDRGEEVRRRLRRLFQGQEETLKFQSSCVLWSRFDDREALDYILAQVKKSSNEDIGRRYGAISLLRDPRNRDKQLDAETVEKFLELMDPKDQNLRLMVAETLSWYGGEEVIRALIPMMADTYQPIAQMARRKLLEHSDKQMVRRLLAAALEEARQLETKLAADPQQNAIPLARQKALQKHIEELQQLLGKAEGDSTKPAKKTEALQRRITLPDGSPGDPFE